MSLNIVSNMPGLEKIFLLSEQNKHRPRVTLL